MKTVSAQEYLDVDSFAVSTNTQCADREFPCDFMSLDRERALKVNAKAPNTPSGSRKMATCVCGSGHKMLHGSLHYCKTFLKLNTYAEKTQYIRSKIVCYRCLKLGHRANKFHAKISCSYCIWAGKGRSGHNPSLCTDLSNAQVAAHFAIMADVLAIIHEDLQHNKAFMREVYQVYTRDISNVHQDLEEEGELALEDIDSFGICYTPDVGRAYTTPSEWKKAMHGGEITPTAFLDIDNIKATRAHAFRLVGRSLIGEQKRPSNTMSDVGSTGSFITEKLADTLTLDIADAAFLSIKTWNGIEKKESFNYETKLFNHRTNKLDDVRIYGTDSIGQVVAPNSATMKALDEILQPHNMSTNNFSWPEPGEIEVLLGGNYVKYGTSDPPQEYQEVTRPENLHFKSSPVYPKPIVIGVLQSKLVSYSPCDADFPLTPMESESTTESHLAPIPTPSCSLLIDISSCNIDSVESDHTHGKIQAMIPMDEYCQDSSLPHEETDVMSAQTNDTEKRINNAINLLQQVEEDKTPTKDCSIINKYLTAEGTIIRTAPRCPHCSANCLACNKANRMSPQDHLVLKRMKDNISKIKLSNGHTQYVVKYLLNNDPAITLDPKLSNFVEANKQACRNYKKLLSGDQGK